MGVTLTPSHPQTQISMQKMKFRGFKLFHDNHGSAESMVRQIDEFPSFFTPSGDQPLFVDCGANIGVSVLEWKTRWPQSRVICFEPDPFAFAILQKTSTIDRIPTLSPTGGTAAENSCGEVVGGEGN